MQDNQIKSDQTPHLHFIESINMHSLFPPSSPPSSNPTILFPPHTLTISSSFSSSYPLTPPFPHSFPPPVPSPFPSPSFSPPFY